MRRILVLLAALVVVGAACGDDDGGGPSLGGDALSLADWCAQGDDLAVNDPDFDPTENFEEFGAVVDELRTLVDRAPTDELRDAGRVVADAYADIAEQADSVDESDPASVLALLDTVLSDEFIEAVETLDAACGDGSDSGTTDDEASSLGDTDLEDVLGDADLEDVLGDTDLEDVLGDADLEDFLDDTDLDVGSLAQGDQLEEYQDCFQDFSAQGPGDNDGCDALYDACADGDYVACNDLYTSANVGSDYEDFGATCGGRVELGAEASLGACQLLG